jgi:beta-lactamase regulating signal transducer with metallopeptidase domain
MTIQALGWNALEASVLAVAVGLLIRMVKMGPATRHLLWLLVILKLIIPPVGVHSLGLSGACSRVAELLARPGGQEMSSPSRPSEVAGAAIVLEDPEDLETTDAAGGQEAPELSYVPESTGAVLEVEPAPAAAPWSEVISGALAGLWMLASSIVVIRQARKVLAVRALVRLADPAPREIEAECAEIAARLRLSDVPRVKVLPEGVSPMVWAFGRPVVVLPRQLLAPGRRTMLRNVLAHELAHVKRRDPLVAWVELVGICLYFWLPAFWWACSRLRRAADQACDAWAVSALGSRKEYAESLLLTVQLSRSPDLPVPALGYRTDEGEAIQGRLIMIMRGPLSTRPSWLACLAIVVAGALVLPAAPRTAGAQEATAGGGGTPPIEFTPNEATKASPIEPAAPATSAAPAAGAPVALPAEPETPVGVGLPGSSGEKSAPRATIGLPSTGTSAASGGATVVSEPTPRKRGSSGRGAPNEDRGGGGSASAGQDTERRLADLEGKMDRILDQLAALRKGYPARGTPDETRTYGAAGAPGMPGMSAGARTSRRAPARLEKPAPSTARAADPNEASDEETQLTPPATPRRGAGSGAGVAPDATSKPRTYRGAMNPEKRAMIEKMNRDLEDRIRALRAEHRAAVEKLLGEEGAGAYEDELKRHPMSTGAIEHAPGGSSAATSTFGGDTASHRNLPVPPPPASP